MATRNRALERYLVRDPRGPVGVDLTRRALRVRNAARVLCPVDMGRLRSSLTYTDPIRSAEGLVVQVGTNVVYSLPVHEGARSKYAPYSWRVAAARGAGPPPRRFLTNALPHGRG
jgi:hypothetical protein